MFWYGVNDVLVEGLYECWAWNGLERWNGLCFKLMDYDICDDFLYWVLNSIY